MLKRISISQFVIISHLTLDFDSGLTVVTGETGAGKSILLDAMGAMMGDEPDREAVRQGFHESVIETWFEPPTNHAIWPFLKKHQPSSVTGPQVHIKRVTNRTDGDEITVNAVPVSLEFLKELGIYLLEIHGQFANQSFLASESQLMLLDAFGAYPPSVLENVATAFLEIERLAQELKDEKTFFANADRERAGIEQLVGQLEKLGLKQGLYQKIKSEFERLTNARNVSDLFQSMNAQLIAQGGVELSLVRIDRLLEQQTDEELDAMKVAIKAALEQARLALVEMSRLAPRYIDVDTGGIYEIERKMRELETIAKAQKMDPDKLFDHYQFVSARLTRIRNAPARIKELDVLLIQANETYRGHANILSRERKKAAKSLGEMITGEVVPLRLMSAEVQIEVTENPNERTIRGFNNVSFIARMNPGQPFSPIAKTASGGELARLILALKMILQKVQAASTLIFDEIDTGVGGAAAAAIGGRIAKLAEATQVVVITHSPQVASRGDQHLHVSKRVEGEATFTVVENLDHARRVGEVSRMLAGDAVTDESSAAASTLISEARASAAARRAADDSAGIRP